MSKPHGLSIGDAENAQAVMAPEDVESLNWMSQVCYDAAQTKGFHEPRETWESPDRTILRDTSPGERMMLIVSEVAEMLEALRDNADPANYYEDENFKPQGVASELADVFIRCFDYAGKYGIDIGSVIEKKLAYNATRAHMHGRKM